MRRLYLHNYIDSLDAQNNMKSTLGKLSEFWLMQEISEKLICDMKCITQTWSSKQLDSFRFSSVYQLFCNQFHHCITNKNIIDEDPFYNTKILIFSFTWAGLAAFEKIQFIQIISKYQIIHSDKHFMSFSTVLLMIWMEQ